MPEWIVNAWVTGSRGRVRITATIPEKSYTRAADIRAKCTAVYVQLYKAGPEDSPDSEMYPADERDRQEQET